MSKQEIDGIPVISNRFKWDLKHNANELIHYTECSAQCYEAKEHGPESFPYHGGTWEKQTEHMRTEKGLVCSHCGAPSRVELEYNEGSDEYKWPLKRFTITVCRTDVETHEIKAFNEVRALAKIRGSIARRVDVAEMHWDSAEVQSVHEIDETD